MISHFSEIVKAADYFLTTFCAVFGSHSLAFTVGKNKEKPAISSDIAGFGLAEKEGFELYFFPLLSAKIRGATTF